ncbi:MAG TPA: hypothetical protein DCE23_01645 [Firmicutes bacterium]|nr:hypothetical protein [Bacillota bacterium]
MIYMLDGLDNNPIFYILIILLIFIVIAIFYLVYTQHKEMVRMLNKKDNNIIKSSKDNIKIENTISNLELPKFNENNNIEVVEDNKNVRISQITDAEIPDKFDYTQALWQKDEFDLAALSHELENHTQSRKSAASKYEEEQEEQAIISYDELIKQSNNTKKETIASKVKQTVIDSNDKYEHEESFLNDLKELNNTLK